MRPLLCIVLCWIGTAHLAGSFFIPNKRTVRARGREGQSSFSDILGKMNELMNFAISVTKTSRKPKADVVEKKMTGFVCPSYKCSDKIEPGCRQSVYYVIQGQRCMGCDVDICKVERRRENARMPFKHSNINADGAIEQRIHVNPFNIENRWAISRNDREQFDRSNSLQSMRTDSEVDRLPPGSENSWITGSLF